MGVDGFSRSGQVLNGLVVPTPEVSKQDRGLATAIHLAGVIAPLWLPFLAWLIFRGRNRFVSSHAWQEVVDGIFWKALLLMVMVVSLSWTAARIWQHHSTNWVNFTWEEVMWRVIMGVAVFLVLWLANLVQAVVQATRAWKGLWPRRELKKLAKAQGLV